MKIVNILLGGPESEYPEILKKDPKKIKGHWVAADYGATYLLKQDIVPEYAVGDFDSSSNEEYSTVKVNVDKIIKVPAEKDFTDSQLAIKTASENFKFDEIHVYGATGGRIDHLLVNLFLVEDKNFSEIIEKIFLIDNCNHIRFFKPGFHQIKKINKMKYVSFINLGKVKKLNLINSKYTLKDFSSNESISWASNEFISDTIDFSFEEGSLIVIQNKDKKKTNI